MPDCDKVLLVQAELDGELGAAEAAGLAAHRAECPICEAAAVELAQARALVRDDLYQPVPEDVRHRVMTALAAARPARPAMAAAAPESLGWWHRWWSNGASFGLGAACAAALAVLLLMPAMPPGLTEQVIAGHVRALQPGHLQDVASEDRHTVKPWFTSRLPESPQVPDLAAQGFVLMGGRVDVVGHDPVATIVYKHAAHTVSLTTLPPGQSVSDRAIAGYNVRSWSDAEFTYIAVSDLPSADLALFERAFSAGSPMPEVK